MPYLELNECFFVGCLLDKTQIKCSSDLMKVAQNIVFVLFRVNKIIKK